MSVLTPFRGFSPFRRRGPVASGGGGFSPSDIAGLQLWLSDTGSDPSIWSDLSGNGRDFTQATGTQQPSIQTGVLNGRQVRRFDGVDDILSFGGSPFLQQTTIAVFSSTDATAFGGYRGFIVGPSGAYWMFGDSGSDSFFEAAVSGGRYVNGTATSVFLPAATCKVVSKVGDASHTDTLNLGAQFDGLRFAGCDIAEVIIYDSALSSGDRHNVEVYLGAKYGITIF